jgi:NTE family protein
MRPEPATLTSRRSFVVRAGAACTLSVCAAPAVLLGSGCNALSAQVVDPAIGWPRLVMPPRPVAPRGLALVLGSGGPRGFAHVGVLKALARLDITPDLVVGSSVGAVLGAMVAARMPAAQIEALALKLTITDVLDFSLSALLRGTTFTAYSVSRLVRDLTQQDDLARLPLPYACVASRLGGARPVPWLMNAGYLPLAIQASAAVVGTAPPVLMDGVPHTDGDLAAPLPVRAARQLGAKRVIAVDISAYEEDTPAWVLRDAPHWEDDARRRRVQTAEELSHADALLHIRSPYFTGFSLAYRRDMIERGMQQTLARADALRALAA